MNPISRWIERRRVERDLAAEMADHVAEKIDQLREEGCTEEEARAIARRSFGNVGLQQEDSRAAWGWTAFEQLWQDIRFGCRVLVKAPGFSIVAVTILALGIGMNTAMFSAVKAVLLSALPYPEPERLVTLLQVAKDGHLKRASGADFRDWRDLNHTVEHMAGYEVDDVTIFASGAPRRARLSAVNAGFFEALAIEPSIGRAFSAEEQKPGGPATLVLGYELAQSLFGSPASAIQSTVRLGAKDYSVIGVMPPRFNFPDNAQLWSPDDLFPDKTGRSSHNYRVVGRMKSGVTVRQVQADMDVVAAQLGRQYVDDRDEGIRVTPLFETLVRAIRPALLVLQGAVTLVLLIACVNISNLQLARAAARRKEIAMRRALGAARSRLIRQLLTESVLLSAAGGLLGLALAKLAVLAFRNAAPVDIPRIETLQIDPAVLAFTAALSLLAGILFGVLPALDTSTSGIKAAGVRQKRWSHTLVIGQIALAMVLLSGAALLFQNYWKLAHVETGLDTSTVYTTDIAWPVSGDGNPMGWFGVDGSKVRQAAAQIVERIGSIPGVQAAALAYGLPYEEAPDWSFEIEGRPLPADPHLYPVADYRMVTFGYFKAFGIPIVHGRGFTADDERSPELVAIVNHAFQKKFFPGADPLGHRIRFFGPERQFISIVGVVPDVHDSGLKNAPTPEIYGEYLQNPGSVTHVSLVVRGPARVHAPIAQIVASVNPTTAVSFQGMDTLISGSIARERFQTTLLALFASCALLLALIGIYGLLSYTVSRQTKELSLRMALGATSSTVTMLVLRQGGLLIVAGVTLGSAGALIATRAVASIVTDAPSPASTLPIVAVGFAAAALLGCYLPARRASRIDPSTALRVN
jgi:putative ABC transport system permease protein